MGLISIEGLYKSYSKGNTTVEVLKGVDLRLEPGSTVAIVGASGAGKSTLLNVMGALDRPTAGAVLYDGKPVFAMDDSSLAGFRNKTIGFVFQFHHLLPEFSALENVMLPALIGGVGRKEAAQKAEGLLREVGLAKRLTHKPGELSGGEQQRVAIVRALMRDPEAVLADEPTGNLDTTTGREVFDMLLDFNLKRKTTLAIVTHNEDIAKRLSRRVRMADGKIKEE